MTGRDVVSACLRLMGAVAPGESIADSEASQGLESINRMIDSWSNERLMIFERVREEFSLVSGTQSYTMGSGADFSTTRPQKIDKATIEDQSGTTTEHEMRIVTLEEWAEIQSKSTQSDIPFYLYPEYGYPNVTLQLYPVPASTDKVVLYSWKPLSSISSLSATLSFPPGYEEALIYNGAVRLAPEYGKALPPEVLGVAMESKAALKRMNNVPRYLKVDTPVAGASRVWNYRTGGYE